VTTRKDQPASGERKLVTLLFADLTGYTALASSLDPEEVYGFIRPGMLSLQRIVEGFGGTVPQIMGDGFMAVFGVPSAHEDDDERAVRAALAVRDHADEINAAHEGVPFPRVHAGVNSGEVMVAPSDEPSGFALIGDVVNTASRLADLAAEGSILVDTQTRERTAHAIRYGPARALRAKGKADPLTAFEALGARTAQVAGRRGSSTVFVDRIEAIERVRAEVEEAERTSRSRVLVVTGEPGTGKSRMAAELRRRRIARVLVGRCPSFGQQLPLHALAEAVAMGIGVDPGASAAAVDRRAAKLDRDLPPEERRSFGRNLRLLLGAERPPAGQARGSVNDAVHAGRHALEILARERPLVVVIDDLHWADVDLLKLLHDADRRAWQAPVVFLALSRPAPGHRGLPEFELASLGVDDMRTIAAHVLGSDVPDEAVHETLERAGGNPLFLEETLGMLVEAGTLRQRDGTWEIADPGSVRGVPSTLRRLIAARLDGLPTKEKATLQDAAVSGEATWDRLLDYLSPGSGSSGAVNALLERGLLVRRDPAQFPETDQLEVKHALIRDVAYGSVPRAERSAKHLAIAAWLEAEAVALPEEPVALVARHHERAWELGRSRVGPTPSTRTAQLAAGSLRRWADRTFAYDVGLAASIYDRALAVARSAADAIDRAELTDLLIGRAESLIEMGRHREALSDASEARRIAERIGDRRRRARAILCLGRTESDLGRSTKARALVQDARRLFHAEGDVRGEAWALHRRSETWGRSDPTRELDDLEESYRLFSRSRDRWGMSVAAQDLAFVQTLTGGRGFRRWFGRAEQLAGDEGDLRSRAALARTAGTAAFYRGEYRAAIDHMEEAKPLAERSGLRYAEADAIAVHAMAETFVGSPARALELGREVQRLGRELDSIRLRVEGLLAEGRAAQRLGRLEVATRRVEAARRLMGGGHLSTRADVYFADALMRLERGAFTGLSAVAVRASRLARQQGWALWEPLGFLVQGRASLASGRSDRAERELGEASELARAAGGSGTERLARLAAAQVELLRGGTPPARSDREPTPDDPEALATWLENRGLLALRDGDPLEAQRSFEAAAEFWEPLGRTVWSARALRLASSSAATAGSARDANDLARRSRRVFSRLKTPAKDRAAIERAVARVVEPGSPPRRVRPTRSRTASR
jgi:class 3 adenylate cyclase/tetratricopeptide (TPR) repeat protein